MAVSMYGFVEAKLSNTGFEDWYRVIDSTVLVSNPYELMGCLFGVKNFALFDPLFADRGLPEECSEEVVQEATSADYYKHHSWCSYSELQQVDLEESALAADLRVLKTVNGISVKAPAANEGEQAEATVMSRGEALANTGFEVLMELMGVLAKRYGNDGVRWVVYFDGD